MSKPENHDLKKLNDVLQSLRGDDDAHWTNEGKPDLNVVKEKYGEYVSRGFLDKEFPQYTRTAGPDDLTGDDKDAQQSDDTDGTDIDVATTDESELQDDTSVGQPDDSDLDDEDFEDDDEDLDDIDFSDEPLQQSETGPVEPSENVYDCHVETSQRVLGLVEELQNAVMAKGSMKSGQEKEFDLVETRFRGEMLVQQTRIANALEVIANRLAN